MLIFEEEMVLICLLPHDTCLNRGSVLTLSSITETKNICVRQVDELHSFVATTAQNGSPLPTRPISSAKPVKKPASSLQARRADGYRWGGCAGVDRWDGVQVGGRMQRWGRGARKLSEAPPSLDF